MWDAPLGYNPSFVWRSMLGARPLLDRGVRWKIGNGLTTKIWGDAWLGGDGLGKIISPPSPDLAHACVHSLIDHDRKNWKIDTLYNNFLPLDIERILKVPISKLDRDDVRVWYGNDDGIFRVKDAYKLARSLKDFASCSKGADPLWKKLWRLNIPRKARMFIWRAVWDILPHNANLLKKGVLDIARCPRCGVYESAIHVFRDCCWARQFWSMAPVDIFRGKAMNIRTWVAEVHDSTHTSNLELLATLMWQLWYSKSEFCFENVYSSPEVCFKRAKDTLSDYQRWNGSKFLHKPHHNKSKLCPPKDGMIKLNFDAAVNAPRDRIGLGVVARDAAGTIQLVASGSWSPFTTVEMAELAAAEWAVSLASSKGWSTVEIEGDAAVVIDALNNKKVRSFHSQIMVDNIRSLLSSFQSISFSFCSRDCNSVAHRLAQRASHNICNRVWIYSSPIWISDLVCLDLLS